MKIDFEKVGIIAAFFAENTKGLYVTKLLKLFYYLDFLSYKLRGASVTNDIYVKLPYGPVPSAIKNEIDTLSSESIVGKEFKSQLAPYIELKKDLSTEGTMILCKQKDYNLRKLSNVELDLMKGLSETFKNTKAKTLSTQTHNEKPWKSTSANAIIDYKLSEGLDLAKILPNLRTK